MTVFFTAVGFTCDLKVLYKYGMRGIQFAIIVFLLVIFQNIIGVGYAKMFDLNPLLGLCTGSAAMTGGPWAQPALSHQCLKNFTAVKAL